MEDYLALKAEILLPAYNGMNDDQIANKINTDTIAVKSNIDISNAKKALIFTANQDWGRLVAVAEGRITSTQQVLLRAIQMRELFLIQAPISTLEDAELTQLSGAIDLLINDGIMSAPGKAALTALARPTVKKRVTFGFLRDLYAEDIRAARKAI